MSDDCKIVRELIPLKDEALLGENTEDFVSEHLKSCDGCRHAVEKMHVLDETLGAQAENALTRAAARLRLRRRVTRATIVAVSVLAALVITCYAAFGVVNPIRAIDGFASVMNGQCCARISSGSSRIYITKAATSGEHFRSDDWEYKDTHGNCVVFGEKDKSGEEFIVLPLRDVFGLKVWEIKEA